MADFEIRPSERFTGDFSISEVTTATPSEARCIARVRELLDRFADDERADLNNPNLAGVLDRAQRIRLDIGEDLMRRIQNWCSHARGAHRDELGEEIIKASHRLEGVYSERRLRLERIPFTVSPIFAIGSSLYSDIEIATRDVRISEEKQRFKVDVDRTLTVIKAVLSERKASWWHSLSQTIAPNVGQKTQPRDARLHEYLNALCGIARVGLMNVEDSQTPFAELALKELKEEFVAREAGVVKNAYVYRLGVYAAAAIAICMVCYLALVLHWSDTKAYAFRNFFLLAAGTALGTWLSFSIRRVVLTFADLALLEEDRLQPQFRIAFMIGITFVLGLLLWTKAVGISVGNFTTDIAMSGSAAFLIGALSGIAERTMASAVSRRADEFASRVGSPPAV